MLFLNKPVLILGAGGHASVIVDILREQQRKILGIVSPEIDIGKKIFQGISHFHNDDDVLSFSPDTILLVNGIGSLPKSLLRAQIYEKFILLGYEFETVVASNALVSKYVNLAKGSQILSGAIVQTGVIIGENTIINSGAIIEHDCCIGRNNHIAPGVTLSGQVTTQSHVHIGTGATVIQSVNIGRGSIVGAGSTVLKNVAENMISYSAKGYQKAFT